MAPQPRTKVDFCRSSIKSILKNLAKIQPVEGITPGHILHPKTLHTKFLNTNELMITFNDQTYSKKQYKKDLLQLKKILKTISKSIQEEGIEHGLYASLLALNTKFTELNISGFLTETELGQLLVIKAGTHTYIYVIYIYIYIYIYI